MESAIAAVLKRLKLDIPSLREKQVRMYLLCYPLTMAKVSFRGCWMT